MINCHYLFVALFKSVPHLTDVLHLWEFNKHYHRDSFIMIFLYIVKLLEIMIAAGFRGRLKEICFICWLIVHFTVIGGNEAGVDIVLIQPIVFSFSFF